MKPTNVIAFPGVLKTPLLAPEAATPKPIAASPVLVAAVEPKMEKTVSPAQLSSNLQAQASALLQQGNGIEARPLLRRALQANPANSAARQQLADLLVEGNALAEAAALLREGVQLTPERSGLWMSLARLELEQGSAPSAMATLEKGLVHAGQDAQYNAFYAVLLQRAGRHDQAVTHYITALRADPSMPNWLVGAGISLQALGKNADALEAFVRARDGGRLQGTLFAFVEQRIEQLK
jgi:MSHA biogenesis protein MshN